MALGSRGGKSDMGEDGLSGLRSANKGVAKVSKGLFDDVDTEDTGSWLK